MADGPRVRRAWTGRTHRTRRTAGAAPVRGHAPVDICHGGGSQLCTGTLQTQRSLRNKRVLTVVVSARTFPAKLRRAAAAVALALVASAATASPTDARSGQTASAYADPCSYLSDAAAHVALGVPLSENVQHARASNDLCVYRVPERPDALAFVNVVRGKASALARFAEVLRFAGAGLQPIAGVGDVAYAIGANVIALRDDTFIVAGIGEPGASSSALRTASIELARGAAASGIAVSAGCGKDRVSVREAEH